MKVQLIYNHIALCNWPGLMGMIELIVRMVTWCTWTTIGSVGVAGRIPVSWLCACIVNRLPVTNRLKRIKSNRPSQAYSSDLQC